MGFSRQEYWSGLPFPTPGDLLDLGIEPTSLSSSELAGRFFTTSTTLSQPRHHKEFLIHLEMQQEAWTLKGMIKMYGCVNTISILPHGMSTISILPGTFSRFRECEWHLSE